MSAWVLAAADGTDVNKDLRTQSTFYVVFCSRDFVPGHAFVLFGRDDAERSVCAVDGAWGYYPKDGTPKLAQLGRVPGKLYDEYLKPRGVPSDAARLIVKMDEKQYKKAEAVRQKWDAKTDYKLLEQDCVSFVTEVAKSLDLKVPSGVAAKHPQVFVRELAKANK
jgi:hypothetical protein